jgi:ABC-2 type transport system permease protein
MNSTMLLVRAELSRFRHNPRYFIFTLLLPVLLYVGIGRQHATIDQVDFKAFYMVAMATMGAFSGALTGNVQRISQEKKDGWIRQLRLTPLPANGYVIAKLITSMMTTVPSILIVLLLGRFYGGIHLPLWQWAVIAVTIWFGCTIFAALAVAVGYKVAPDQVQPVALILYFGMALFGGLWFPFSGIMRTIGEGLPTGAVVKICADVMSGQTVAAPLVIGLVVWMAVFIGLAVLAVRSTAESL